MESVAGAHGGRMFTIQTSFKPLLFSGGRSEGESRLLAPLLFCTPTIL